MWLEKIIENKKRELDQKELWLSDRKVLDLKLKKNNKNFLDIFLNSNFTVIGEIKSKSPSEGFICPEDDFDPVKISLAYQQAGVGAISVLVDKFFFNGSYEILKQVSDSVAVPVLCKEFILDAKQIYKAKYFGADAVLLIVRILNQEKLQELIKLCEELNMTALVEVFTEQECERAIDAGAKLIGINNRDLSTLELDLDRSERLKNYMELELNKPDIPVIFLSGVKDSETLFNLKSQAKFDGVLIGTALMKAKDPSKFLENI